jgi:hypothetical protein
VPPTPSIMDRLFRSSTPSVAPEPTTAFASNENQGSETRSVTLSDISENLQELQRNLHAANLGQEAIATSLEDNYEEVQETEIEMREQKKKSQKCKREKRKKSKRRHRSKKTGRSSDRGDDPSSSSSSSSSFSDTSSHPTASIDSNDSTMAFGPRNRITNVADITDLEERRRTSTRIGKQVKKLTNAAKLYEVGKFYTDRGTIEQRKQHFLHWTTRLRDMLGTVHRYNAFLRYFPVLDRTELTVTANTALGYFLRLKLGNAMHSIEEAIGHENKDNGYLIL